MPDGNRIPNRFELLNPTLSALRACGGTARVSDIETRVIEDLRLPSEVAYRPHKDGRKSALSYQLSWARTYLKQYGLIDNSAQRGVWSFTAKGEKALSVNPDEVIWVVHSRELEGEPVAGELSDVQTGADTWRKTLLEILRGLPLETFGQICQRLLQESEFSEVEIIHQPAGGGVYGVGILEGFGDEFGRATLWLAYQSKRRDDSIGPEPVQDFRLDVRYTSVAKADKGLFITTGTFTPEAQQEAARPGPIPIELMDGAALVDRLKELRIGVKVNVRTVEEVSVDTDSLFNSL